MKTPRQPPELSLPWYWLTLAVLVGLATLLALPARSLPEAGTVARPRMPRYDADGDLLLPEDWPEWIFVGATLGMSYSEGAPGHAMFQETLMEPEAYRHFRDTGEFREGTMLLLLLQGPEEQVPPARHGRFAGEIHGVEMAVKDSAAREEVWAYYNFGGMGEIRDSAEPFAADRCKACHDEHAAYDNVFLQFYPLLADAAPDGAPARRAVAEWTGGARADRSETAGAQRQDDGRVGGADEAIGTGSADSAPRLALAGLDPVMLLEGREERGNPEMLAVHDGLEYHFVSEVNRARFAGSPGTFAVHDTTCPVMPGTPIDPAIFAVRDGRIRAFGSTDCRSEFLAAAESSLAAD